MSEQTTPERPKNLREKLVAVMQDVGGIGKHGRNKDQGYDYQSAADIFEKVQAAFAKHGIAFLSDEQEVIWGPHVERKDKGPMFVCRVKMQYSLLNTEFVEGSHLVASHSGIGFDTSDKALNKAKTAALKYFLKQTLLIGEDEDDGDRETITPTGPVKLVVDRSTSQLEPSSDDFLADPLTHNHPALKARQKEDEASSRQPAVAHPDEPISVVAKESIISQCKELDMPVQRVCEQFEVTELDQLTQKQYSQFQAIADGRRNARSKTKKNSA